MQRSRVRIPSSGPFYLRNHAQIYMLVRLTSISLLRVGSRNNQRHNMCPLHTQTRHRENTQVCCNRQRLPTKDPMKAQDLDELYWTNIRPHTYMTKVNNLVIYVERLINIHPQYNWRYIIVDSCSTECANTVGTHKHGVYTDLVPTKELVKTLIVNSIDKIEKHARELKFIENSKRTKEWP